MRAAGLTIGLTLSACAGRDPHPVALVQPQDQHSDCAMIKAEIEANNAQAQKLAEENGWKVAQNVLTGAVRARIPTAAARRTSCAAGLRAVRLISQEIPDGS